MSLVYMLSTRNRQGDQRTDVQTKDTNVGMQCGRGWRVLKRREEI
jgi:hypothetical protein